MTPGPARSAGNGGAGVLTTDLERALLRELVAEYKRLNVDFFRGTLTLPTLELSETTRRLGCWNEERRSIELSREALLTHGWGVVSEVLKHEMAHQYVSEVLQERSETAHGPAFRGVCARLGIDGAATGLPAGGTGGDDGEKRLVDRIARLLALAESPNVHEAEAAASAAQRLMLKYNLDVSKGSQGRAYGFLHVGKASGRVGEAERMLAMILGRHFFVEVIWVPVYRVQEGKRGTVLELCGSEANLKMADYVHAFLTNTAEQLWGEHKRQEGIRSNRDRRVFLAGVMTGFADKLATQSVKHREEGLVWVRDADLDGYFRKRHPRVRHIRYAGGRKNEAYAHGKRAAAGPAIGGASTETAREPNPSAACKPGNWAVDRARQQIEASGSRHLPMYRPRAS